MVALCLVYCEKGKFCYSSIHIWDPFVGSGVHQIDGSATGRLGGPVTVMTTMTPSSSCLILAATQHDGLLHLRDCRVGQVRVFNYFIRKNKSNQM